MSNLLEHDFEIVYVRIDPKKFFGKPCTIHTTTRLKVRDVIYMFFEGKTPSGVTRRLLLICPIGQDRSTEKRLAARLRQCEELAADIDLRLVRD